MAVSNIFQTFLVEDIINKTEAVHYLLDTNLMPWLESRHTCRGYGGDLVTINNCEEYDRISTLMKPLGDRHWIGLNNRHNEDQYVWADGDKSTFRSWKFGQPDDPLQRCVYMFDGGKMRKMEDGYCEDYKHEALCKLKSKFSQLIFEKITQILLEKIEDE